MRKIVLEGKRIMKHFCRALFCPVTVAVCTVFSSCFKDEPLNSECDITTASVHLGDPATVFYNASDTSAFITKDYASTDIVFNNVVKAADLTRLSPVFTVTPGAVISPASGTERDFSGGAQTYKVTSEDGNWSRVYTVRFARPQHFYQYDFDNYFLSDNKKYYVWSDMSAGETPNWCTANAGFGVARSKAKPEEYPSTPDPNGYEGACVKLTTVSTGSWGVLTNKRIAAGNLFLGSFDLSKALTETLKSTLFGVPTDKKPLCFTGYYKYQRGEHLQDKSGNEIEGDDNAAIYAVLYKNHDAEGNSVVLTGEDIMDSPQRVGMAKLREIKNTAEWTYFDVAFDYWEDIDADTLANLGYNLVIVCSSSENGDLYQGAIGSTLWVDKLSIGIEE